MAQLEKGFLPSMRTSESAPPPSTPALDSQVCACMLSYLFN